MKLNSAHSTFPHFCTISRSHTKSAHLCWVLTFSNFYFLSYFAFFGHFSCHWNWMKVNNLNTIQNVCLYCSFYTLLWFYFFVLSASFCVLILDLFCYFSYLSAPFYYPSANFNFLCFFLLFKLLSSWFQFWLFFTTLCNNFSFLLISL